MSSCPEREMALHAYLDGELDDAAAADMDAHLAGCAVCRAELERLDALSAAVRRGLAVGGAAAAGYGRPGAAVRGAEPAGQSAPDTLRAGVRAALGRLYHPDTQDVAAGSRAPRFARRRPAWREAAAAAVILLAVAGGYAIGAERSRDVAGNAAARELLSSHLRALLPGRLTDVTTSDRHQVKPWFAGRLDFAPPVPELAGAGFPLVGGRIDFFAGERAAAIVYMRRRHVIDLYMLPARPDLGLPAPAQAGYNLVAWREGPLQLVAISDVDRADLERFARLHAAAASTLIAPAPGR